MYSLLAWLEENEQLAINPFKRVKKTDGRGQETVKRRAASHSEMERLLSEAGNYAVAYLAAATTGLRRGELSKLEWGDLPFGRGATGRSGAGCYDQRPEACNSLFGAATGGGTEKAALAGDVVQ
jgi:integrase